jgi:peptide-methionine (R)-S-oxide reductase|tara:strand:- start:928 stop:1299 length:372 start_codon:yes stop_codon:yes gene_type:complete
MEINKNHLTEEQIQVTQFCGTEAPFSGELLNEKRNGVYKCAVCNELLFSSSTKYESGSGWPSFFDAIEEKIEAKEDTSMGMKRTEILCKNCSSHLGHVFPDGPKPTGNRYCVNSLSLSFESNE